MTRLLRLAAPLLAVALLAGPALAQTPQPSPSHLAAAREVAISTGIVRSFDAIIPQFAERIRQQAVTRPELTKDLNEVLEGLKPEMELQKQQMVNTTARIFATRLTEAELKEIVTFFKSPAGQRYVQTQPLVLDDLVQEMKAWSDQLAEYIMVRVRAEMGKRGQTIQ